MISVFNMPADTDWDALRETARGRIELYRGVPGLVSKSFIIDTDRGHYGGCYLWQSRQAMDDFLASETFAGAVAKFGRPQVTSFEVAAYLDKGAPVGEKLTV
jgi:hypothetical protein